MHVALRIGGMTHPESAGREPRGPRGKRGSHIGPAQCCCRVGRSGKENGHTGIGSQAGSGELGRHTARTQRTTRTGYHSVKILGTVDLGDQGGIALAGITVVQTVDIGEQNQRVCADQVRHQRGQSVIVTETEFCCCDSVVFVDDGHRVQCPQSIEGSLSVAVLRPPSDVVGGE